MKDIRKGDKVKDRYGEIFTVKGWIGNQVYVTDSRGRYRNIHRTKCYPLTLNDRPIEEVKEVFGIWLEHRK